MTKAEIQNIIGKWVFITGNPRIEEKAWKHSFPQDWFGRVIGYEVKLRTVFFQVRCYRRVSRDCSGKRKKHHHLTSTFKYLKFV